MAAVVRSPPAGFWELGRDGPSLVARNRSPKSGAGCAGSSSGDRLGRSATMFTTTAATRRRFTTGVSTPPRLDRCSPTTSCVGTGPPSRPLALPRWTGMPRGGGSGGSGVVGRSLVISSIASSVPFAGRLFRTEARPEARTVLWGRRLASPIGLAAGFDVNARMPAQMVNLGFGCVSVSASVCALCVCCAVRVVRVRVRVVCMNLTACNKDCDHVSYASVILLTPRQSLDRVGWDGDPGSDDAATDTEGDRGAGGTGDAQPDGVHVGWLRGGCKAPCPHACPVSQPRYGSWRFGCACFDVFPTSFPHFFLCQAGWWG